MSRNFNYCHHVEALVERTPFLLGTDRIREPLTNKPEIMNASNRNKFLRVTLLFFFFGLALSLLLFLFNQSSEIIYLNEEWYRFFLFISTCAVAVFLQKWLIKLRYPTFDIFNPVTVFTLLLLAEGGIGYLGYLRLRYMYIVPETNFIIGFDIYLLAVVGLTLGLFAYQLLPLHILSLNRNKGRIPSLYIQNLNVLGIITNAFLLMACISYVLWFGRVGVVPLLQTDDLIDYVRFKITETSEFSMYGRLIYLGIPACGIKLFLMALKTKIFLMKNSAFDYILTSIYLILAFSSGAKANFIIPFIMAIYAYSMCITPINIKKYFRPKYLFFLFIILYALVILTNYRGLGRVISDDVISDFFIPFFSEFRELSRVVDISQNVEIKLSSPDILVLDLIPNEFFELVGMDKRTIRSRDAAYVLKDILGYKFEGGGVRIGFPGELFLNWRYLGVLAGMSILGYILALLFNAIVDNKFTLKAMSLSIICVQLMLLHAQELYINLPSTYLYMYLLMFMNIFIILRPRR
jgi:hypothetical protein